MQQVAPVLNPDRCPDEGVRDSAGSLVLLAHFRMGRGSRMADQGFNSTKAYRIPRYLEVPQKIESSALPAFQFYGKKCTGKLALRIADPNLFGILEESRVVHLRHSLVRSQ